MTVHKIIGGVKSLRSTIDTTFCYWYQEIFELAETIGVTESVPRKTSLMRNCCNTLNGSPQEHYKRAVAIHSLINQLEERFSGKEITGHVLLCLIPSVFLKNSSSRELPEHLEEFSSGSRIFHALNHLQMNWGDSRLCGSKKAWKIKQVFLTTCF